MLHYGVIERALLSNIQGCFTDTIHHLNSFTTICSLGKNRQVKVPQGLMHGVAATTACERFQSQGQPDIDRYLIIRNSLRPLSPVVPQAPADLSLWCGDRRTRPGWVNEYLHRLENGRRDKGGNGLGGSEPPEHTTLRST